MRSVRTATRAGRARNFVNCRSIVHFEKRLPLSCQYFAVGQQAAIHALADGYDVFVVTDASGGGSPEVHEMAVRRMTAVGRGSAHLVSGDQRVAAGLGSSRNGGKLAKVFMEHGERPGSHTPGKCSRSALARRPVREIRCQNCGGDLIVAATPSKVIL